MGRPLFLFNASEAPWVRESGWPDQDARYRFPTYVTDGPFLYRLSVGALPYPAYAAVSPHVARQELIVQPASARPFNHNRYGE